MSGPVIHNCRIDGTNLQFRCVAMHTLHIPTYFEYRDMQICPHIIRIHAPFANQTGGDIHYRLIVNLN